MLVAVSLNAQQSAINTIFKQYAEDDRFTAIYVSEAMFSLFGDIEVEKEEDQQILDIVSGLKELHVLTTEASNGLKLYEEANRKIDVSNYTPLLTVKDEGDNVRIYIKKNGKLIDELLLLVGSTDEFVLLSLVGEIDLQKIANLSKVMDIQGLEQLKNLKGKGAEGDQ